MQLLYRVVLCHSRIPSAVVPHTVSPPTAAAASESTAGSSEKHLGIPRAAATAQLDMGSIIPASTVAVVENNAVPISVVSESTTSQTTTLLPVLSQLPVPISSHSPPQSDSTVLVLTPGQLSQLGINLNNVISSSSEATAGVISTVIGSVGTETQPSVVTQTPVLQQARASPTMVNKYTISGGSIVHSTGASGLLNTPSGSPLRSWISGTPSLGNSSPLMKVSPGVPTSLTCTAVFTQQDPKPSAVESDTSVSSPSKAATDLVNTSQNSGIISTAFAEATGISLEELKDLGLVSKLLEVPDPELESKAENTDSTAQTQKQPATQSLTDTKDVNVTLTESEDPILASAPEGKDLETADFDSTVQPRHNKLAAEMHRNLSSISMDSVSSTSTPKRSRPCTPVTGDPDKERDVGNGRETPDGASRQPVTDTSSFISPAKTAIHIMAELASLTHSPPKTNKLPHQGRNSNAKSLNNTPQKESPPRTSLRNLAPKPTPCTTPTKLSLSDLPPRYKKHKSPYRQNLQRKARAIMPKGYVLKVYTSPVKKVAASITAKAHRQGAVHAKPHVVRKLSHSAEPSTNLTLPESRRTKQPQLNSSLETDQDMLDSDYTSDGEGEDKRTNSNKQDDIHSDVEAASDAEADADLDSQNEEEEEEEDQPEEDDEEDLAELMAASTTIK